MRWILQLHGREHVRTWMRRARTLYTLWQVVHLCGKTSVSYYGGKTSTVIPPVSLLLANFSLAFLHLTTCRTCKYVLRVLLADLPVKKAGSACSSISLMACHLGVQAAQGRL